MIEFVIGDSIVEGTIVSISWNFHQVGSPDVGYDIECDDRTLGRNGVTDIQQNGDSVMVYYDNSDVEVLNNVNEIRIARKNKKYKISHVGKVGMENFHTVIIDALSPQLAFNKWLDTVAHWIPTENSVSMKKNHYAKYVSIINL